ncbi:hypothetical protein TNCV_1307171 [Trichonephila clavipes]|nr:hypothetical protein TNCV_1307171 [Trichonephila clavipes]
MLAMGAAKRTKIRLTASGRFCSEWMMKRDGSRHEKMPKKRGGATRGGKANQDATWVEPNTKLGETARPLSASIGLDQSKRSKQGNSSISEWTSSATVFQQICSAHLNKQCDVNNKSINQSPS